MASGLLTIKLEDLRFYSYHGLYPDERRKGGEYRVSLEVDYRSSSSNNNTAVYDIATGDLSESPLPIIPVTELSQTIDYVQLYAIVQGEMSRPRDLLETIAMCIAAQLAALHPCQRIAVEIKKLTVPIDDFSGNTAVRYEWNS